MAYSKRVRRLIEEPDDDTLDYAGNNVLQLIRNSRHKPEIKEHCRGLLLHYEKDQENNSSSLHAVQTILKIPPECCSMPSAKTATPVTPAPPPAPFLDMDHADLIQYLNAVWDNMDQTVYGQLAAKCEIMEYLVARLLGNNTPRVLGLVGPPGVGKTLLGVKCVAKALNQSFHPITVGGLRDVTYFNGSLRCWKGAHHGVFADILSVHGGKLVVFVDELDKIASETASDVYGFLTHALDPMCNDQIHDFYLGINLNLQQVTFVLSYNDPSILPRPLRDRIKEIQMPAFDLNQKLEIVETFLIPELLGHYGISPALLTFPKTVIEYANNRIESNAMQVEAQEGGVRNLKKGYQGLVDKLMVSLISDYQSYQSLRTLRRTGQLPSAVAREVKTSNSTHSSPKVTKSRTKFAPYLATTPIQLPYTVTINDINRCLPSYK